MGLVLLDSVMSVLSVPVIDAESVFYISRTMGSLNTRFCLVLGIMDMVLPRNEGRRPQFVRSEDSSRYLTDPA